MSEVSEIARAVLAACEDRGIMVATAESCTGGMIAAALTEIPGSSRVFERGFVTYSNEAKQDMLGVLPDTLRLYGAVSRQTALEMAAGALAHSRAQIAVSVTGIAGPDGGSPEKPVGLVWFGLSARGGGETAELRQFDAMDRGQIRQAALRHALKMLLSAARA
jgi:nicotinamide-nucleotide amidase